PAYSRHRRLAAAAGLRSGARAGAGPGRTARRAREKRRAALARAHQAGRRRGEIARRHTAQRALMSSAEATSGSPFWRFSLRFYREPQVADACIALQDGASVDVNLLLFLLWQAALGREFSASDVARLEERIGVWRNMTVIPLRTIRRALKSPPALVERGTAEAFRTKIKAVELEAERLQQEAMYELARAAPLGRAAASPQDAAHGNIAAYAASCAKAFPQSAVGTLLAAF